MTQITQSNIQEFTHAAVARAATLKASPDEDQQVIGELLAHTAGVIRATVSKQPVDTDKLDPIFEIGNADFEYEEWLEPARREIQTIASGLRL